MILYKFIIFSFSIIRFHYNFLLSLLLDDNSFLLVFPKFVQKPVLLDLGLVSLTHFLGLWQMNERKEKKKK